MSYMPTRKTTDLIEQLAVEKADIADLANRERQLKAALARRGRRRPS